MDILIPARLSTTATSALVLTSMRIALPSAYRGASSIMAKTSGARPASRAAAAAFSPNAVAATKCFSCGVR